MQTTSPTSYEAAKNGFIPQVGDDDLETDVVISGVLNEGTGSTAIQQAADAAPGGGPFASVTADTPRVKVKDLRKGKNPRTYFDPAEMNDLKASIKALGILQAILVRKINGDLYEIIAGERRYRAAKELFGDDYEVPVTIMQLTDDQVNAAAAAENIHRSAMSAIEEAHAAARELGIAVGDRTEAARRMGMSLSVLESRLLLLNCSDKVQTALNERKIKIGHAELFATLTKENQDKLVGVVIAEGKSIADLKQVVQKISARLENAIFDKNECNACPHNSTLQQEMFSEAVASGACTNPTCYQQKTEAILVAKADGLKDEYPVVRILRIGDNETRVKLTPDGDKGVGPEQAEACRGCSNFGAVVSGLPQALGQVYGNQCFDTTCNSEKVAAWQAAIAPKTVQTPGNTNGTKQTPGTKANDTPAPKAPPVSITVSDRIKEYRHKLWRDALMKEIASDPQASLNYLLGMCLNGNARHIDRSLLSKAFIKLAGKDFKSSDLGQHVTAVATLNDDQKAKMTTLLATSAIANVEVHDLVRIASHRQLDLRKHWSLDAALLVLLSKSEIDLLCKEIKLIDAFGDNYKKITSGKKDDIIAALLKHETFNYSATIPSIIAY